MDIHAAAAAGDVEQVAACLSSDPKPMPNAPDEQGRSAIFYAQILSHDTIVSLLTLAGWTPMPEGTLSYTGPGGRAIWWRSTGR